jgi:hypothetical protein
MDSRIRLSLDSHGALETVNFGRLQFDHAFPKNPFHRSPALRAGIFFAWDEE